MDSSSEESFAWTNTSNSCSEVMAYEEESDSKSFKKKLQKELFQNGDQEEPTPRGRKKVKREPSSSPDAGARRPSTSSGAEGRLRLKAEHKQTDSRKRRREPSASPPPDSEGQTRKKKKAKRHRSPEPDVNGGEDDAKRFLQLKVEREQAAGRPPSDEEQASTKKKKAKRHRSPQPDVNGDVADDDDDVERLLRLKVEREQDAGRAPPPDDERASSKKKKTKRHRSPEPDVNGDVADTDDDVERLLRLKVEREQAADDERAPSKKKKTKRHRSPEPGDDDVADDDADRQPEVKQERTSLPPALQSETESSRKKRKKLKRERSPESVAESELADAEESPRKKKKKKRKRETHDDTDALVDKFEAEETVVGPRPPSAPPGPPPRAIRERITFEDDSVDRADSDSELEPGRGAAERASDVNAALGARLARYLSARAHVRALVAGAGAAPGPDDDVWLVRAPRSLRAAALRGATLPVAGRARLQAGGRGYEAAAEAAEGERIALLRSAGGGLRALGLPLMGTLRLRARVPRARAPPAAPPAPPPAVPLPATRARHPLLGADYERGAPRTRPRPRPPTEDEDTHKKKKKKKKRERPEREPEPQPEAKPEGAAGGGRRRAPERWDSERAIEESLFGA